MDYSTTTVNTETYSIEYKEFKQNLDNELNRAADGFVKIGYLLRQAEDTDVLRTSGYRNVTEFAAAEYGLTKDIVSRYININKRFSEGGYSDCLASSYQNYGLAKLAEMLTLPDEIVEQIPDSLSKAEIREIKKEYDEEQRISDIEVAIEKAEEENREKKDHEPEKLFEKVIYEYLKTNPNEYIQLCHSNSFYQNIESVYEAIAPSGTKVIISRVAGEGKLMLTINAADRAPELINMRSGEKSAVSWAELSEYLCKLCGIPYEDDIDKCSKENAWSFVYDEDWPEEEKEQSHVGVQVEQETEPKKKKESKVVVARPKKGKATPVQQPESGINTIKKLGLEEFNKRWSYAREVIKVQGPAFIRYISEYNMPAAVNIKNTIDDMWNELKSLYEAKPYGLDDEKQE